MRNLALQSSIKECIQAIQQLETSWAKEFILNASQLMADAFENGGKLLIAGNGGSLCDAAHFGEELTGFFRQKRRDSPSYCLNGAGTYYLYRK